MKKQFYPCVAEIVWDIMQDPDLTLRGAGTHSVLGINPVGFDTEDQAVEYALEKGWEEFTILPFWEK